MSFSGRARDMVLNSTKSWSGKWLDWLWEKEIWVLRSFEDQSTLVQWNQHRYGGPPPYSHLVNTAVS